MPCKKWDGPPASTRSTECPASARRPATVDPPDPEPMTTKSKALPFVGVGLTIPDMAYCRCEEQSKLIGR